MKLPYPINTIKSINFFALLLFVFWLPLEDEYLPTILAFWIFTWLLEGNFKTRFKNFPNKLIYLSLAFFIFLYIFSLLYTDNIDYGLFEIQRKLSIIFFPILIIGSNEKIKSNYNIILIVFVVGNIFASIYIFSQAFFSNLIIENGGWYIKYWLSPIFEKYSLWELIKMRMSIFSYSYVSLYMHPAYFTMYLTFSIAILTFFLKNNQKIKFKHKIGIIISIIFLLITIFLIHSRAGFITFFVVVIVFIMLELKKHQKKRYIIVGTTVILISITFISLSSNMQLSFEKLINLSIKNNKLEIIKQDARFQTWYSATELIKENFWFGTAPADAYDELMKKYINYNFITAKEKALNSHNQYLESFTGLGIIGFISLLSILIAGFIFAYKNKHYLMFYLLLILSINFLFESMLNRMAGVLFMMIFYSMFVFGDIKHTHFNTYKNNK